MNSSCLAYSAVFFLWLQYRRKKQSISSLISESQSSMALIEFLGIWVFTCERKCNMKYVFNTLRDISIDTNLIPSKNFAIALKIMETLACDVVSMAGTVFT